MFCCAFLESFFRKRFHQTKWAWHGTTHPYSRTHLTLYSHPYWNVSEVVKFAKPYEMLSNWTTWATTHELLGYIFKQILPNAMARIAHISISFIFSEWYCYLLSLEFTSTLTLFVCSFAANVNDLCIHCCLYDYSRIWRQLQCQLHTAIFF